MGEPHFQKKGELDFAEKKRSNPLTREHSDVGDPLESRRVIVEIRHAYCQLCGRLVHAIAGYDLERIFRSCFRVQGAPENDASAVSVDAERPWMRDVTEAIIQRRRTVDVVGGDCRENSTHWRTYGRTHTREFFFSFIAAAFASS